MPNFDPPSDPYGGERSCRICDHPLEYNPLVREWECTRSHDEDDTESVLEHVDIIASGYEWDCPNCDHLNQTIEVTEIVKCDKCGHSYATNPAEHARG